MTKLLLLDDAALRRLLQDPKVVQAFPFMKAAAAKAQASTAKTGCKPCQRRKMVANVGDFDGIKSALGSLSAPEKARFKQLVGAEQVRLYFRNAKSQTVKLTF